MLIGFLFFIIYLFIYLLFCFVSSFSRLSIVYGVTLQILLI